MQADRDFKRALFSWRDEHALVALGAVAVREWGPTAFMSDDTVQRLVDCFHADKLPSVAAIGRETQWREDRVTEFGDNILALVDQYRPPPPPVEPVIRGPRLCGSCRQPGHNREFYFH